MKTPTLIATTVLMASALASLAAVVPLKFELNSSSEAVALQFDVRPLVAGLSFEAPTIDGATAHISDADVLASGATRFLVYSPFNIPLSTAAVVSVTMNTTIPSSLVDGIVAIENLVVADAVGNLSSASPNSLPVILSIHPVGYFATKVGSPSVLSAEAIDIDGSIESVSLLINGLELAGSSPVAFSWTPALPDAYPFTVTARETPQAVPAVTVASPTVLIRVFNPSIITTYENFADIHFGPDKGNPIVAGKLASPLGSGVSNLLAYFLGIDPWNPDLSALPSLERGQGNDLLFRFQQSAYATGVSYSIVSSPSLFPPIWEIKSGLNVAESSSEPDLIDVAVTIPIEPITAEFFELQVKEIAP